MASKEWWRNWYASLSPERRAERQRKCREYYSRNREAQNEQRRQYYQDNRTVQLTRSIERQKRLWNTPEEIARRKTNRVRRRSKERVTSNPITHQEWLDMVEAVCNRCHYCGVKFEKLTQDHVIPISKGGTHTKENIVPACGDCNSRKAARTPEQLLSEIWGVTVTPK